MRMLSRTFRSIKCSYPVNPNPSKPSSSSSSSSQLPISQPKSSSGSKFKSRSWCVYLILSTSAPIKTYVGVTTDFSRRLKQHNGEIKGGAKASRAGRPWVCACLVQGFISQNEACEFESKWKSLTRKLPRKRTTANMGDRTDDISLLLLQHRQTALNRVQGSLDCSHLEIDWQLNPS